MIHNLSRPWRLSLLYTLLHAITIQCIPSQRWNIEAGLPSEQDPRALSPMGDGLASMHQRRGLDAAVVIDEWTAMGDSYASGVGAGENIPPMLPCRRYDHSYPVLMDSDNRLGASAGHKFNPVMCSGSTFKNIQSGGPHSQVDQLGNPTVATLTIGGNNVGFRAILTACIYRFYAWRSGDCATEIANSQAIIDSNDFSTGLTQSINDALKKATNPDFHLFVTGYAAFFNQDTTQCNKVNVALWIGSSAYWTQDVRKSMNTLLGNLNAKISQVTNAIGSPKVKYVDVDHLFNTHRFCEEPYVSHLSTTLEYTLTQLIPESPNPISATKTSGSSTGTPTTAVSASPALGPASTPPPATPTPTTGATPSNAKSPKPTPTMTP